jgi:hypothetical protein
MAVIIKDLLPPPRIVQVGEGHLAVRGLRLDETIALLTKEEYKSSLATFFSGENLNFTLLVAQAPDMVATVIALGADAVGQEEDIKLLPVGTQVEAVTAVWEMSVPSVKKLSESLQRVSVGLAGVRAGMSQETANP